MTNNKTVLGIDENIEGLLCYVLGWITGIVFLILEKDNKFVRFHAMQSLVTFLALFIISMVISLIPILGAVISLLLNLLMVFIWLFMMYKAYQGEKYKLPYAGDFAEEQIFGKGSSSSNEGREESEEEKFVIDDLTKDTSNEGGQEDKNL